MWNAERKLLCLYRSFASANPLVADASGSGGGPSDASAVAASESGAGSSSVVTEDPIESFMVTVKGLDGIEEDEIPIIKESIRATEHEVVTQQEYFSNKPFILIWQINNYKLYGLLIENDVEQKLEKFIEEQFLDIPKRTGKLHKINKGPRIFLLNTSSEIMLSMIREMNNSQFEIIDLTSRPFTTLHRADPQRLTRREDDRPGNTHYLVSAILSFNDDLEQYDSKQ